MSGISPDERQLIAMLPTSELVRFKGELARIGRLPKTEQDDELHVLVLGAGEAVMSDETLTQGIERAKEHVAKYAHTK